MKHNKKIISSRLDLVLGSLLFLISAFMSVIAFVNMPESDVQDKEEIFFVLCLVLTLAFFSLQYTNRAACVVWVEDGMIKRKGLLFGFYKELPIRSIRTVRIQRNFFEKPYVKSYIYLIPDASPKRQKHSHIFKDSYICFSKNKKNLAFLRTFWSGEVESRFI